MVYHKELYWVQFCLQRKKKGYAKLFQYFFFHQLNFISRSQSLVIEVNCLNWSVHRTFYSSIYNVHFANNHVFPHFYLLPYQIRYKTYVYVPTSRALLIHQVKLSCWQPPAAAALVASWLCICEHHHHLVVFVLYCRHLRVHGYTHEKKRNEVISVSDRLFKKKNKIQWINSVKHVSVCVFFFNICIQIARQRDNRRENLSFRFRIFCSFLS